jgi:hypothetical protein
LVVGLVGTWAVKWVVLKDENLDGLWADGKVGHSGDHWAALSVELMEIDSAETTAVM